MNTALLHLAVVFTKLDLIRMDRVMAGWNRAAPTVGLPRVPWTPAGFLAPNGRYYLFDLDFAHVVGWKQERWR